LPKNDSGETLSPTLQTRLLDYFGRPLLLVNQTVNDKAARYDAWIRIDGFKGEAYRQALVDARQNLVKQPVQIFTLRNPTGNIFNNIALTDYSRYFLRRDDLLALRGLVEFQFKLLQQGITDSDAIVEALKVNQESLRHPYSGAQPIWDKEKRRLSYPAVEGEDNARKLPAIQI
jgi:hypothetical protein